MVLDGAHFTGPWAHYIVNLALLFAVAVVGFALYWLPPYFDPHVASQGITIFLCGSLASTTKPVVTVVASFAFIAASCSATMLQDVTCAGGAAEAQADAIARLDIDGKCADIFAVVTILNVLAFVHLFVLGYCLVFKASVDAVKLESFTLNPLWIAFAIDESNRCYVDVAEFTLMLLSTLSLRTVVAVGVTPLNGTAVVAVALLHGLGKAAESMGEKKSHPALENLDVYTRLFSFGAAIGAYAVGVDLADRYQCDSYFEELNAGYYARCRDEQMLAQCLCFVWSGALAVYAFVPELVTEFTARLWPLPKSVAAQLKKEGAKKEETRSSRLCSAPST